jgi:predicted lysophospholipase L1 biosynthesis ABC-type transport system permease subunit
LSTTYIGIYPASYQNPFEQIFAVIGNIFQGFTSVILLLIMYFVSYLVLKNVIRAQERSTLILRSIGAYKKDLYQTLIFELMIVMMAALFIVVGFLYLNQAVLNWVPNYLQFFAWNNYLVMTVLLLGLAILLGRRFQKKLFTRSVMSALRSA